MPHQNRVCDLVLYKVHWIISVTEKMKSFKWLASILSVSNCTLSETINHTQAGSICACFQDKLKATSVRSHTSMRLKIKPKNMNLGNSWPFPNFLLLKHGTGNLFYISNITHFCFVTATQMCIKVQPTKSTSSIMISLYSVKKKIILRVCPLSLTLYEQFNSQPCS